MPSVIRFPYDPFFGLFDDVFGVFTEPLSSSAEAPRSLDGFRPRVDLHGSEESDVVTATFELPGLASEDVTIDVHHNRLIVSGEAGTSTSHEEGDYSIRERQHGKFSRTLRLPVGTKPEDVKAKMENGLLTVTFPKVSPEQQPQKIAIQ